MLNSTTLKCSVRKNGLSYCVRHYGVVLMSLTSNYSFNKQLVQASLVAQWLRICLPMQGTRVRVLVWEDPTCRGATGPVSHNY